IFEIFPSFVPVFGFDGIQAEVENLHELWDIGGKASPEKKPVRIEEPFLLNHHASPAVWERALGSLVIGRKSNEDVAQELETRPGVSLVNRLISEFRGSMIVNVLRLTSRLMMLAL